MSFLDAKKLVFSCLDVTRNMTKVQKSEYQHTLITSCIDGFRPESGYAIMRFRVGVDHDNYLNGVCKTCFCNTHGISESTVDRVVASHKSGVKRPAAELNDRTAVNRITFRGMKRIANYYGFELSRQDVAAANIPNSSVSISCYAWMARYFSLVGDEMPNSEEIHLESMHIKEIWEEYRDVMKALDCGYIALGQFGDLWMKCFPYVKIREFKAVSGKCDTCMKLSKLRRTFHDDRRREYITMMHALHRSAYMGERMTYGTRRDRAIAEPSKYLSVISDGMAQNHCQLPHLGNQDTWTELFPQHLQGMLMHGRGMRMYRTFHTVNNCSSLQLHSFLLMLEEIKKNKGRIPDTIYYQIDEGSENTAKCVIAMCELLVARRLTKKIVLTRLLVGHTHEDIDSKFGVLWRYIRKKHIHTPQEYKIHIEAALSLPNMECKVKDIFAIPDYKSLLDKHTDPLFEG